MRAMKWANVAIALAAMVSCASHSRGDDPSDAGPNYGPWTVHSSPFVPILTLAGGQGKFLAFDVNGGELTSTDATNWKPLVTPTQAVRAVAYGNGRFVGLGNYSNPPVVYAFASTDGSDLQFVD
jgi:hypothetical protein